MAKLQAQPKNDAQPFIASPTQEATIARAIRAMGAADLVLIEGRHKSGRTSILAELQRRCGGKVLDMGDLLNLTTSRHARRYEQSLFDLIRSAMEEHDIVYFDGVTGLQMADRKDQYSRFGMVSAALRSIRSYAQAHGKRFVVTQDYHNAVQKAWPSFTSWDDKGVLVEIPDLVLEDYRHIVTATLGADAVSNISFEDLFGASTKLSAGELTLLSRILADQGKAKLETADVIRVLDDEILHSNVDLGDVEAVTLDTLVGVQDIVARLDRAILLPLRDPDLARELKLEPKHGVLLHGPPGTGKTTIGRALAHMMRGKFFMIDGDFAHDGQGFYRMVDTVFAQAMRNSPSVIFIDDADIILGDPEMQHFGRYLLTKLDGLQSESMARVCVMMTAMNIGSMPAALLRSGRLEVWLETRLPSPAVRADMIESYAKRLPLADAVKAAVGKRDQLVEITDRFTPADLRRLVSDAAGRLGFDRHKGKSEKAFGDYLTDSAANLQQQKNLAEIAIGVRGGTRYH